MENTNEQTEYEWIDDAFRVEKTRGGLFESVLKDGTKLLSGLTQQIVIDATRWHLKCQQEGTLDDYTRIVNDGTVGGKL